jgi:uncharacterized protein YegP (UPF0339 family)
MNSFQVYRENNGDEWGNWRWSLHASNGKLVAEGGEGYKNASDMVRTVRKHIVRDSGLLETALQRALSRAWLTKDGKVKS